MERSRGWSRARRYGSLAGLVGLAMVPVSLVFAASPAVYPPVDRTTGGPTGSSLLGSALVVVGLMLLLPRVCRGDSCDGSPSCAQPPQAGVGTRSRSIFRGWGIWVFFGLSWLVFVVTEAMGGTHFQAIQIVAMLMLLPWVWWLPRDWAGFSWPEGSRYWRGAMFGWWGLLVVSGLLMYQPGVLDHIKFTQGLVAHSHLAMAGFTSSFCTLLLVLLSGRPLGGRSVLVWQAAALVMIVTLAWMGWREGDSQGWMIERPLWRELGMWIRIGCGVLLVSIPVIWFKQWRDT